ncbi:MAG: hypothetical protein PHE03_09875 [Bacteroidales bacterium]|nr:hypothetical protein [Bacteroidales bacterium]
MFSGYFLKGSKKSGIIRFVLTLFVSMIKEDGDYISLTDSTFAHKNIVFEFGAAFSSTNINNIYQ